MERSVLRLGNQILEEKIQQLSSNYIYQEAVGSLLLLLLSSIEDEDKKQQEIPYSIPYEIHPDILEQKEAVHNYICNMEEILNGESEERLKALEDCMRLKQSLLSIYENIYGYFSLWNVYSTVLSDEVALRKYRNDHISQKTIDWDRFYLDCKEFLNHSDTLLTQKSRISQLLKCFYLKMARSKYFDLLNQCLNKAFQEESKTCIDNALRAFQSFTTPESTSEYGRYFPEISQWLAEKQTLKPEELDDEALSQEYQTFQSIFEDLTHIEEYFCSLFNDINACILLFSLTYDFEELTEGDISYSDLYHTVCSILSNTLTETEKESYMDTLIESLENAVEPVIDKANTIGRKELTLLEKVTDFENLSEETKKILITENFIRSCYYADLNEELFQSKEIQDTSIAEETWKSSKFNEFLESVQTQWSKLPPQTRRVSMQMLFGALPPIFSVEETLKMMEDALESAPTPEHRVLILDKAGMVFSDNNFSTNSLLEACEHNHEHTHDCGCGHHHH